MSSSGLITQNFQIMTNDNKQQKLSDSTDTAIAYSTCCTLFLFPCGAMVKSKYGSIEGMITAQSIRFDKVQYEISYFNSGDQKTVWMNENEFETNVEKRAVGFK